MLAGYRSREMSHDLSQPSQVAAAYDALAVDYDRLVEEDFWMRQLLWGRYLDLFHAGEQVLDVACGTGLDTLFLARHGIALTGIDASPGMIAQLREKAERAGLAVDARVGDAADLSVSSEWPAGSFDGILSAFAGLNTVDLDLFAAGAARLLRPGGRLIVHLLAPAGLWSRLRLLARFRPGQARKLGHRRDLDVSIGGHTVHHALPAPEETYRRWFAAHFRLRRCYALGFLWPQSANAVLPCHVRHLLGRLEPRLGALPFLRGAGRFFVLEMEV
jgi:ubiquinone/menaquinone biosynthesis C-methylase UbiE